MAKDDYDIILCRVLVYLYGVVKRKTVFSRQEFLQTVKRDANDDYFTDVLRFAQDDGLVKGVVTTKPWGHSYILISDYESLEITSAGIRYLKENGSAQKALQVLKESVDIIAELAGMLGLFI